MIERYLNSDLITDKVLDDDIGLVKTCVGSWDGNIHLCQECCSKSAALYYLNLQSLWPVDNLDGEYLTNRNNEVLSYQLQ